MYVSLSKESELLIGCGAFSAATLHTGTFTWVAVLQLAAFAANRLLAATAGVCETANPHKSTSTRNNAI